MDDTLIQRVQNGDAEAFRDLVEKYQDFAYTMAIGIVRNASVAEEVVQDAFLNAYKGINSFKFQSKFSTWFYKIVYHQALKSVRKKRLETVPAEAINWEYMSEANVEDGLLALNAKDQQTYINRALTRLSPQQGTVLRLFYLDECPLKEINEITGIGLSTIKSLLYRGRKQFYNELQVLLKDEAKSIM